MAAWRLSCYVCGEGHLATSLRNVGEFAPPPKDVKQEPCPEANSPSLIRKVVSGAMGNWPGGGPHAEPWEWPMEAPELVYLRSQHSCHHCPRGSWARWGSGRGTERAEGRTLKAK